MRPRILLVNTSSRPVVQTLRDLGFETCVITTPSGRDWYDPGIEVRVVDDMDDLDAVRKAAISLWESPGFDRVVAPSEYAQSAAGFLRSYFELPGAGFSITNRMSNKHAMKSAYRRHGVPCPTSVTVGSLRGVPAAAQHLGWPVVVKPALGGGGEDVFVLHDPADLRALEAVTGTTVHSGAYPLVVEQFVEIDEEFHVDAVVVDGEVEAAMVSRYFEPVLRSVGRRTLGSFSLPASDPRHAPLLDLHARALAALGLTDGVTHFEALLVGGELVAGEMACRPGGGGITDLALQHHGIDLWEALVLTELGGWQAPARPEPTGYMAELLLPRPRGVVREVSPAGRLAALLGVVSVEVDVRPGDTFLGTRHSMTSAGTVLVEAESEDLLLERLRAVEEAFVIEVVEQ